MRAVEIINTASKPDSFQDNLKCCHQIVFYIIQTNNIIVNIYVWIIQTWHLFNKEMLLTQFTNTIYDIMNKYLVLI